MHLSRRPRRDLAVLHDLQRKAFRFFAHHTNGSNGLVLDSTQPGSPCSIAAVGFALACYPVAVERGFMTRRRALARTLAALRFFDAADQRGAVDGVGYRGFFYHFLHADTGRRAWKSELSTIDTTLLLAGMLVAAEYFSSSEGGEREVRERCASIVARVDWRWAQNDGESVVLGWRPESGFLRYRWRGYNEAMLLYVLALAAPDFAVAPSAYAAWTDAFRWRRTYGREHLYAGPLFIHQFSHIWLDLRGIRDRFMSAHGSDYFENSRVATHVQREYAARNPRGFRAYAADCWGLTACDGPGNEVVRTRDRTRRFFGYRARGAPFGPDDGTLSPWAAIASLPFAPDLVMEVIHHMEKLVGHSPSGYGFYSSFNPSYPGTAAHPGWVSPWHLALNQGPIVLMIENYRSGMIWELMRKCAPIRSGLLRAGFRGGWLDTTPSPRSAPDDFA